MKKTLFITLILPLTASISILNAAEDASSAAPSPFFKETGTKGSFTGLVGTVVLTEDASINSKTDKEHYTDGCLCVGTHMGEGALTLAENVTLTLPNALFIGGKGYSSKENTANPGTVTVEKGAVINVGAGGTSAGGHHVDVGNSGSAAGSGELYVQGGTVNTFQFVIGCGAAEGTVVISDGGTVNLSGDGVQLNPPPNQTGLLIGYSNGSANGKGTLILDGGTLNDTTNVQHYIGVMGSAVVELKNGSGLNSNSYFLLGDVYNGYYGAGQSKADVSISSDSSLTALELDCYTSSHIDNAGVVSTPDLWLLGGEINNTGTLETEYAGLSRGSLTVSGNSATFVSETLAQDSGTVLVEKGATLQTGTATINGSVEINSAHLVIEGNTSLGGTLSLQDASLTLAQTQTLTGTTETAAVELGSGATLINYGKIQGEEGAGVTVSMADGSKFQTGTMQVTGRGALGEKSDPLNIVGYDTGLENCSVTLPGEGSTITIGSILEGVKTDAEGHVIGHETQKIYLGDYANPDNPELSLNYRLTSSLGIDVSGLNVNYEYETRYIVLELTTDEVNSHDGTHTVSVGEGSGVLINNGVKTNPDTKIGTIGSYSKGDRDTAADIRISEAAEAGEKQASVEWHGSTLRTVTGEQANFTDGVTIKLLDNTGETETTGTLEITSGSTLNNNGHIIGNTVVESGATLKGSGKQGQTEVQDGGNLVVGNSPGHQTYTGDLLLCAGSETTFSVAGLDTPSHELDTGWESGTYSQIEMKEGSAKLYEGMNVTIEFGGEQILSLGKIKDPQPFSFELELVHGAVTLPNSYLDGAAPDGEIDVTSLITTTFTVTTDEAAKWATAENMSVTIDNGNYQYIVRTDAGNHTYDLVLRGHGTVEVLPEPATATLSLLALAALAARRRRH